MTRRLAAALLLAGAATSARAAQTTVALLPTTGSNLAVPQLAAAGDVLRAHLESTRAFVVVRVAGPVGGTEPTAGDAAAAARASGAELAVVLRVARLAETGQAYLAAYRPDGVLVHTDQLSILGADDLDPALERLAEGLASGRFARDLASIDTVTAREEPPLRKMHANGSFGLAFVALMPMNRPVADAQQGGAGGLGFTWLYDARTFLADVTVTGALSALSIDHDQQEFRKPENAAFLVSMGAYYPFSKGNASPYLGAGAGYGWTRFGGESGHGLQGRVAGGLLLGRLSDVNVKLEVGWFWNAYTERDPTTGQQVNVNGALASLTLLTGP
jgi:hypothetical protein